MIIATTSVAAACSSSAVVVDLAYAPGDDPYAGVTILEMIVTSDGVELVRKTRALTGDATDGDPISLPPIGRVLAPRIVITGIDNNGTVLSRGEANPVVPERGGICCAALCFCSLALFDANDCRCGSDACTQDCL